MINRLPLSVFKKGKNHNYNIILKSELYVYSENPFSFNFFVMT